MEENNVCLSGGANGADLEWGSYAIKRGDQVIHYSFKGHFTQAYNRDAGFVHILTPDQLLEAEPYLIRAAPRIKKYYVKGFDPRLTDKRSFVSNLLRRNWWQVKDADRLYAVTTIKDGIVQGGTAWAVQMFLDRHGGSPCEAYVYDQNVGGWFQWNTPEPFASFVGWYPVEPPRPHGRYAGIGTRELNQAGRTAIREIMQ